MEIIVTIVLVVLMSTDIWVATKCMLKKEFGEANFWMLLAVILAILITR